MASVGDTKPDIGVVPLKAKGVQEAAFRAGVFFIILMTLSAVILTDAYEASATGALPLENIFRRLLMWLGIFFFCFSVFMFWIFWRRQNLEKHLQEANENLLKVNSELTYKNEQITAGIEYASHIQNGILVDKEEIIEHFEEAFIFFKPRDVLSGDFYWFAQREDLLMIAAIDCTGHGVPGALMTILGNELLNHLVYEQGLAQPDLILGALDLKLRIALQKRNEKDEVNDGMEMSLCVIDSQNSTLQFSGAKNSLYWARNGAMQEVKGSHFSVGGKQTLREKVFDLYAQQIEKGDVFYIFTDGFQDQLNEEGRKFMSRHLREFLLANHALSLKEQEQKLEIELENWRGKKPQTDDVLVMGLRVA